MTTRVAITGSYLDDVLDHGLGTVEGGPDSPDYNSAIVPDGTILIDRNVTTLSPIKTIDGNSLLTNQVAHV